MVLSLIVLFALVPLVSCGGPLLGPDTHLAQFKGRITLHGLPVPAHVSLEVKYKVNDAYVPVSLIQFNSPSNYNFVLSGVVLRSENISNDAILRVQSKSLFGGSKVVHLQLKDNQKVYEQDVKLDRGQAEEGAGSSVDDETRRYLLKKEKRLEAKLRQVATQSYFMIQKEASLKVESNNLSQQLESLRKELREVKSQLKAIEPQVILPGILVKKTTKRPRVLPTHKPLYFGLDD